MWGLVCFLHAERRYDGRTPDAMAKPTLLPDPTCLHLQLLDGSSTTITLVVRTTTEEAECPLCHQRSTRIHSRYVREVADLPSMGCAVRLQLHVRRFFCSHSECARQIFTERLPSVVAPYARRTTRLTEVFTLIGFALGGEAGKRLASGMSLVTSPIAYSDLFAHSQKSRFPRLGFWVSMISRFANAKPTERSYWISNGEYRLIFCPIERQQPWRNGSKSMRV